MFNAYLYSREYDNPILILNNLLISFKCFKNAYLFFYYEIEIVKLFLVILNWVIFLNLLDSLYI